MEKGKVILFRNKMQVIVKNNYQIAKKHLQVAIKDVWPKWMPLLKGTLRELPEEAGTFQAESAHRGPTQGPFGQTMAKPL
jgi:hypothetical protein